VVEDSGVFIDEFAAGEMAGFDVRRRARVQVRRSRSRRSHTTSGRRAPERTQTAASFRDGRPTVGRPTAERAPTTAGTNSDVRFSVER
jgi:hypothetical protein